MTKIKLSIIIPAYNEEANMRAGSLEKVEHFLVKQSYPYEVIVVDDGSKDETIKLIEWKIRGMKNFRLIKNVHAGKAIAVMTGLLKCSGEIALFTDMDQATPIEEINKFLPKFNQGYDIVIGSRSGRKGAPFIRKSMAWGFSMARRLVLGLPFKDTQCGFKGFTRQAINVIFPLLLSRWQNKKVKGGAVNAGFDVETLFVAKVKKFKVAEVPVEWYHVGTERVQAISDSWEALKDILRIRWDDFSNKYD